MGLSSILKFERFSDNNLKTLKRFIEDCEKEKNWLLGYLFKKARIKELNKEFRKSFNLSLPLEPHQNLRELKNIFDIFSFANQLKNKLDTKYKISFDYLSFIHETIKNEKNSTYLNDLQKLGDDLKFLRY